MHRQNDFEACKQCAAALAAQPWHPLATQAEESPVLRLRRNSQNELASVRHRHGHLASEHGCNEIHLDIRIEIVALALVLRIELDTDDQIEITARAASNTRLPLAGHANF